MGGSYRCKAGLATKVPLQADLSHWRTSTRGAAIAKTSHSPSPMLSGGFTLETGHLIAGRPRTDPNDGLYSRRQTHVDPKLSVRGLLNYCPCLTNCGTSKQSKLDFEVPAYLHNYASEAWVEQDIELLCRVIAKGDGLDYARRRI